MTDVAPRNQTWPGRAWVMARFVAKGKTAERSHNKKAADFSAALLVFRRLPALSVAIGANSEDKDGRADADPATVAIAAALDITLAAGSISV